jgi:DNA replication protein DnaC
MLKTLKQAHLDHSDEVELRKIISVDLLLFDDVAIDVVDTTENWNRHDILLEAYRTVLIVVTSSGACRVRL